LPFKASLGKMVRDPISTNGWVEWCPQGSTNREITVQADQGIKRDPTLKITNAKGAGGVAQVVGCLASRKHC
jgi:hypothetical protein